jgi:multicomponent Na+:H+ antiporter subunit D
MTRRHGKRASSLALGGGVMSLLINIAAALFARGGASAYAGTFLFALELDSVTRILMVLMPALFMLTFAFLTDTDHNDAKRGRLFGFFFLTMGVLNAVYASANLLTFYMCFEVVSLLSFPLVLHDGTERARRAALVYIGFSFMGSALVLGGMKLAGMEAIEAFTAGGVALSEPHNQLAFLLFVLGFGCKAGLYPLSAWMVPASNESPVSVGALLSGAVAAMGLLGIVRVSYQVFGVALIAGGWAQKLSIALACLTALMGAMLAYKEPVLKKRLAYSSISQLSYALIGFLTFTKLGFIGGVLQVFFHACAKTGLFFSAGAVQEQTGFLRVSDYRGVGRDMPLTMGCFTLLSLSIIGLPPLGGFAALWELSRGAFALGGTLGSLCVVAMLLSALLSAGAFLPIAANAFFPGKDFFACVKGPRVVGWRPLIPIMVLSAAVLVFGIFPGVLSGLGERLFITVGGGLS